mmetsp:Transcript_43387/g.94493  ORF Transcript_43387/g.94493 Transcript_43387/m.94493 type:complete len:282 (-) Transcript_43387:203-1048(-)
MRGRGRRRRRGGPLEHVAAGLVLGADLALRAPREDELVRRAAGLRVAEEVVHGRLLDEVLAGVLDPVDLALHPAAQVRGGRRRLRGGRRRGGELLAALLGVAAAPSLLVSGPVVHVRVVLAVEGQRPVLRVGALHRGEELLVGLAALLLVLAAPPLLLVGPGELPDDEVLVAVKRLVLDRAAKLLVLAAPDPLLVGPDEGLHDVPALERLLGMALAVAALAADLLVLAAPVLLFQSPVTSGHPVIAVVLTGSAAADSLGAAECLLLLSPQRVEAVVAVVLA